MITADACLDLNMVGIPKYIALRQTIPEKVTPANIRSLRARVLAGSGVLGGAMNVIVSQEDGPKMRYRLDLCGDLKRKEIAASTSLRPPSPLKASSGSPSESPAPRRSRLSTCHCSAWTRRTKSMDQLFRSQEVGVMWSKTTPGLPELAT